MADKEARTGGVSATDATASVVRPTLQVLLDAVVVPALFCAADGEAIMHNAPAVPLLTHRPGTPARLHVHDGTDLWTVISARADDARPFFDLRAKMRIADGQVSDITFFIVPTRGAGGLLSGALVLALDALATRVRGLAAIDAGSPSGGLSAMMQRLGEITGATHTYIVESERGFGAEARVIASWSADGSAIPIGPFDVRGTPSDSFNGRRFVCIPDKLRETYPDDPHFRENDCNAYAGVVLLDPNREQIGIMGALWRDPIRDIPGISAVFTITAVWAVRLLGDLLAQRELKESEQRYAAVFEGSAVPILLIDPDTTQIVDANPSACEFYGRRRDDLMTMSVLQTDALSAEMVRAELARAADGMRVHFASKQLLSEGRLRDVEINVGPITVGGRQVLYSMIHDITDRKRMESELERAKRNLELIVGQRTEDLLRTNAELQQASTARDMVFASLAREMRTSLQTITGFSDVLLSGMAGELTEEMHRQVEMIAQAGRQLSGFASTLLESRRSEAGAEAIEPEHFDLVGLVESVLFGLGSFADEKKLTLQFAADERPIDVFTDRFMCQQILLNLLSNAIRYTDRGGVTVTVSRIGDQHCSVAVADTGPGISQNRVETLFQGPEVHAPAAGIGLPASLRTAGVLHGTIDVQSALGTGSVFTLVLPLSITDDSPNEV
ncbi:MAG: PAS domain S-box protein [Coriobacteriia bacterium]|nr:PAS domain S-box protein [Coriobacteriia bacterium]MBN2839468.1 PAS domain S-box protein [Coriobacteriia bacterium]